MSQILDTLFLRRPPLDYISPPICLPALLTFSGASSAPITPPIHGSSIETPVIPVVPPELNYIILQVTPTTWDYGNVAVGTTGSKVFGVTNLGNVTANGVALVGAPFQIRAGFENYSIPPGYTVYLFVDYYPVDTVTSSDNIIFSGSNPLASTVYVYAHVTGTGCCVQAVSAPTISWASPNPIVYCDWSAVNHRLWVWDRTGAPHTVHAIDTLTNTVANTVTLSTMAGQEWARYSPHGGGTAGKLVVADQTGYFQNIDAHDYSLSSRVQPFSVALNIGPEFGFAVNSVNGDIFAFDKATVNPHYGVLNADLSVKIARTQITHHAQRCAAYSTALNTYLLCDGESGTHELYYKFDPATATLTPSALTGTFVTNQDARVINLPRSGWIVVTRAGTFDVWIINPVTDTLIAHTTLNGFVENVVEDQCHGDAILFSSSASGGGPKVYKWTQAGGFVALISSPPFSSDGFSGIALDPYSGLLYLVDVTSKNVASYVILP